MIIFYRGFVSDTTLFPSDPICSIVTSTLSPGHISLAPGHPVAITSAGFKVITCKMIKEMGLMEGLYQSYCVVHDQVKPRWEFSVTPAIMETAAPLLGQHTETILSDIVRWLPERILSLFTSGKSGRTPTM